MRKSGFTAVLSLLLVGLVFVGTGYAGQRYEFSDVKKIKLEGVSGDLVVLPGEGDQVVVELFSDVKPKRSFRGDVEQDDKTVYLEEHWRGGSSHGEVRWTVYLPKDIKPPKITVSTASGDLSAEGITARFRFTSASGDIELSGVTLVDGSSFSTASGDIVLNEMTVDEGSEFSTASGDVELEGVTIMEDCSFSTASGEVSARHCRGFFQLSSASGDVEMRDCQPTDKCVLSSASGDVSIYLDKMPQHDLKASSASGRVLLDVEDFGDDFTLVMVKREDRGRISCPFDYTHEDTFEDYDQDYEEKIVERGSGQPEVYLRTASGKVIVKN